MKKKIFFVFIILSYHLEKKTVIATSFIY